MNTGTQVVHQINLAEPLGASAQAAKPHKAESWRSIDWRPSGIN